MPIKRSIRPEIMDSVALLVLDAQDCFIQTLSNKESFLNRCAFAIEAARCFKLHTIFTEQAPEKLGHANQNLLSLAHNPKVFSKQSFSALNAPGIERYLRDKEIYHLLIVGLETTICIYQTGLQATDEDVDVTFFTDAISCRRPEDSPAVLDTLTRMGCQALPSESVFYSLLGDTANPYFRNFNDLVKTFSAPDFSLEKYVKNRPKLDDPKPPQQNQQPEKQHVRSQDGEGDERQSHQPKSEGFSDSGEERRSNRRGRRRRGGRGRDRNRDPQDESNKAKDSSQKTDTNEKHFNRGKDQRPERPAPESRPQPAPAEKPADAANPAAPEASAPSDEKPKKRPAKKAAKRVAKKAAKKVARKAAKKTARKVAKKSAAKTSDES